MPSKQIERILAKRKELIERWMLELTSRVGRTEEDLRGQGLLYTDFPTEGVRIDFTDGSFVQFQNAFALERKDVGDLGRAVVVFTEHCGYHEFELFGDADEGEDKLSVVQ
jgi:hypothetical protein